VRRCGRAVRLVRDGEQGREEDGHGAEADHGRGGQVT